MCRPSKQEVFGGKKWMVIGGIIWPSQSSRPVTFVTTELDSVFLLVLLVHLLLLTFVLFAHFNALYTLRVCWFDVCVWLSF